MIGKLLQNEDGTNGNMGWFWSNASSVPKDAGKNSAAKCPVDHGQFGGSAAGASKPAACPVGKFNHDNNMPVLSATGRVPGQKLNLPTEKTESSIPRGRDSSEGKWEYPSPQQMYNALLRKGGTPQDTPEEDVESMVYVHNMLNEGAWQQIKEWESKYTRESNVEPRLVRFTGRPGDLSPRARMLQYAAKVLPESMATPPPFDRHDWTIVRKGPNDNDKEVRYVIDYYSGPDEPTGPTFFLDVRPALDSPQAAFDRASKWTSHVYHKAMGHTDKNYRLWNSNKETRILILGLDGAGKTTILYRLQIGEVVSTVPTIGFNVETLTYRNLKFNVWDLGGQTSIRPYWRCYYSDTSAVIFVVDATDRDRIETAAEELKAMLDEEELRDAALLVFANKQDQPNAMSGPQVSEALDLASISDRSWNVIACSAISGDGLNEGLDWLVDVVAEQ
ncbi:hypothetical protein CANCADRAFT_1812 [Tortispora caseinolytica NRRL Y-17796]|uniref:Holocytochrome c-type synthase n=1 Tax=Tortispora caseinolytica NRRL Y-17796 TaxID=767744 RepID=A0A1E4TEC1_9ASCO|nr:hypothetical protein CANCADRAFT_1812 [Tortispora caseinolytica NRRL Y-17796]